ncbi:MAG: hypothetical protein AB7V04_10360 [Desulfomonilaceae bacterium]
MRFKRLKLAMLVMVCMVIFPVIVKGYMPPPDPCELAPMTYGPPAPPTCAGPPPLGPCTPCPPPRCYPRKIVGPPVCPIMVCKCAPEPGLAAYRCAAPPACPPPPVCVPPSCGPK